MLRKDYEKLLKWKNKTSRKPLLVLGVRQCGKTYLVKKFGSKEFENMAYINFDGNKGLQSIFDYDFDINRIIDEIQDCPRAIQSLKYFCENLPELHVIAAGSLLGIALKEQGISFPVGKVQRLEMFPMSFEEFVIADGGEKYLNGMSKLPLGREISELYSVPMQKYLQN